MLENQSHRFCVAPMMDGTDRHCRYLHRLLSRKARLYTEMITAEAVIHGNRDFLLGFDDTEHPVALQLGGSTPSQLAEAAKIAEGFGYDEVNLNVGCPSDRVKSGSFGACLMKSPALVAECVAAMNSTVRVPVTVKCRIGVDEQVPEESLNEFIDIVAEAGCEVFVVHARKAWLQGLSPKENREIPPLDYDVVAASKLRRPDLRIILNGGIQTMSASKAHLDQFDGVMLGRAAYGTPYILADVDQMLFGEGLSRVTRIEAAEQMSTYIKRYAQEGVKPHHVVRHMLGLFHGQPGARGWRQLLSEEGTKTDATVIDRALERLSDQARAIA